MLEQFQSEKINISKNAIFFLSQDATHHNLIFNSQFLYELKHIVRLSKRLLYSHFRSRFVLLKFTYLFSKMHGLFDLIHNTSRPLIFKLQQEVLKFNDIWMSWSTPKTEPEDEYFKFKKNIENWSFENVSFS